MKSYPKIPRYNHAVVPEDFYSTEDLILLEKTDGQNLRVFLYDEEFEDLYSEDVYELDPQDGDVFIGTKKAIRGKLSDDPDSFKGNFNRLIRYLRDNLDVQKLRELHKQYDSPLVLFGEHMIRHSLDYDYIESPPPAILGFDVFVHSEYTPTGPANPYEETFEGFLPYEEARNIFEQVGIECIQPIADIELPVNPEEIEIPESKYASIQAEGIVFRSDSLKRRSKIVSEEFSERMKKAWGIREDQAEVGEELIAAWYLTNGRIRKYIHKSAAENKEIETARLAETIVYDVWIEEWQEISKMSTEVVPHRLYDYTVERIEEILDKMETNAHLNNADILDLWDAHTDIDPSTTGSFEISQEEMSEIESQLQTYDSIEKGLVEELLDSDTILSVARDVAEKEDKKIGRWVIPDTIEGVREEYWINNLEVLANLDIEYTPDKVNEVLVDTVVEAINTYVREGSEGDMGPSSHEDRNTLGD